MNFLYIIVGLGLLVFGADWLLKASVGFSLKLKISKIIIGLTVVSIATSAPELIVSVKAALQGFSNIAVGNVIGSNIGNVGLILGIVLLINSIKVSPTFYTLDWPVKIIASFLLAFFLWFDNSISRNEGFIFLILFILFLVYLIKINKNIIVELPNETTKEQTLLKLFLFLFFGGAALWLGSELLVKGAVNVAKNFGVSDRIIAITVVSMGTSIPELTSSVIAALKKESDIAIGNVIGSNIFNILGVLGISAIISPINNIDQKMIFHDLIWMLGFAVALMPLVLFTRRSSLFFKEGVLLILAYAVFIYTSFS